MSAGGAAVAAIGSAVPDVTTTLVIDDKRCQRRGRVARTGLTSGHRLGS